MLLAVTHCSARISRYNKFMSTETTRIAAIQANAQLYFDDWFEHMKDKILTQLEQSKDGVHTAAVLTCGAGGDIPAYGIYINRLTTWAYRMGLEYRDMRAADMGYVFFPQAKYTDEQ